jgi:predicted nucleic acid-binding protein
MTVERFSLDTNILVYAADSTAGARHERAVELLHAAAAADCHLTLQALAEFYHAVTRGRGAGRDGMSARDAAAVVEDWMIQFPVAAAQPAELAAALKQAAAHRLAFWDALLLETARAAGCAVLLSEDFQHGRSYGGVLVLDPFRDPAPARLQRLLAG